MDNLTTILAGSLPQAPEPLPPFAPLVLDFLHELSRELRSASGTILDPEWAATGFWLRPSQLLKWKPLLSTPNQRLGRGIVFHITPTNMPTMFLYSFVISLLAGNNNIVRISPRLVPTVHPVLQILNTLLQQERFHHLALTNGFLSYSQNKEMTDYYSSGCDVRLIWGGNASITEIRKSPLPPQSIELIFADRYSLAVFDAQTILTYSDEELRNWVHRFYLDSYEADQNACSSPRLICWLSSNAALSHQAQNRWWHALTTEMSAYDLAPIKVSRKYTDAWTFAMLHPEITSFDALKNNIYLYELSQLPPDISQLSGAFGQFFQITLPSIKPLLPHLSKKVQTITTMGISINYLRQQLLDTHTLGVDRIVPTGQALAMDVIWDGTNLLDFLSRIIN